MKKSFVSLTVIVSLIAGACNSPSQKTEQGGDSQTQTFNLDTTKLKGGDKYYQCEMDPEILSDKPGTCPKCNMALTEMIKQ